MRVMGIDPGLRNLGWGVIDIHGSKVSHVANGVIQSEGDDLARRLLSLHAALTAVVAAHAPEAVAVEQTFVNRDGAGTLKLGQARGIAMLVPAQAGLTVGEYAPNAVKKAVVGVGHADKAQILHMVKLCLPGADVAGPDAADALAIAICHAHHLQSAGHLTRALHRAAGSQANEPGQGAAQATGQNRAPQSGLARAIAQAGARSAAKSAAAPAARLETAPAARSEAALDAVPAAASEATFGTRSGARS